MTAFLTFACFIVACALAFRFGRISRDTEVADLQAKADLLTTHCDQWMARAKERLEDLQNWRRLAVAADNRALAAEAELAKLPKRLPTGRLAKRT